MEDVILPTPVPASIAANDPDVTHLVVEVEGRSCCGGRGGAGGHHCPAVTVRLAPEQLVNRAEMFFLAPNMGTTA